MKLNVGKIATQCISVSRLLYDIEIMKSIMMTDDPDDCWVIRELLGYSCY